MISPPDRFFFLGRGRGEGGFHRGFSVDETSSRGEEGWQRDAANKRLSWSENGRPGFNERGGSREQGTETSPRSFELSAPPVRHKEPSRALSSGNWRNSESGDGDDDDGGGWIVSGSRGSDKWRGSSRGAHYASQGSREDYSRGEYGGGERRRSDSWNRGSHERNSFDDLPEWSKSDSVFEPDLGSFDSSGAFCVMKEKKELDDTEQREPLNEKPKENWDEELNEEGQGTSESANNKGVLRGQGKDATEEKDVRQMKEKLEANTTDVKSPSSTKEVKAVLQRKEDKPMVTTDREEKASHMQARQISRPQKGDDNLSAPGMTSHDEIGANLERVAESCIANLDVEGEEHVDRGVDQNSSETPSNADVMQTSAIEDKTKWFYRDPQGLEQGPFNNDDMVGWFHHGYFTMQLSIRRQCDAMYLPLGEVIKRWGRVPFLSGPAPPPISHQQLMTQQTMNAYIQQQLLQQHYHELQKHAILQQIQQRQQQQQQQKDQHPDLHLAMNDPTVDQSVHPHVLSPHSLPVANHSVAHGGAAEAIWGAEPESPKGAWSPSTSNASVWDQANRQRSPVPSPEQTTKLEDERAKAEAEKREAELMSLKRREEEKRQMLKKQEEEERLQREALQRENELKLLRQKEEEDEKMRREKERKRQELQRQTEVEKRKEAAKQKKETQQEQKQKKESEEQKQHKQNENREQQKQALMRLQKQQQELQQQREEQKRKEEQRKENERKENENRERSREQEDQNAQQLQQHLQQKRMQSNSSSSWGSQNAATSSIFEIQKQEEKSHRAHEEKMRELEARQRQLQSSAISHGWAEKQSGGSQTAVKSLKSIQDEQARQLRSKQSKQMPRPQPAQVIPSGAWSNTWTAGNNNVWAGMAVHADDDAAEDKETGFWAEAVRVTSKTGKSQPQPQKTNANQTRVSSTQPAVANGKKGKKATKEEESVRKLFEQPATSDPFTEWCTISLAGISTSVDIPTFIAFLKDIESPYEIHNYVRDFLGDSKQAQSFAKEFIAKNQPQTTAVKASPITPPVAKPSSTADVVVARGCGGANRTVPDNEPDNKDTAPGNGKNKKKKKQRMQKVDPRILGFSVNAATERVNTGEIQSVDES